MGKLVEGVWSQGRKNRGRAAGVWEELSPQFAEVEAPSSDRGSEEVALAKTSAAYVLLSFAWPELLAV